MFLLENTVSPYFSDPCETNDLINLQPQHVFGRGQSEWILQKAKLIHMADVVEAEEKFTKVLDRLALQLQPEVVEEDEGHLGGPLGLVEGGQYSITPPPPTTHSTPRDLR